MPDTDTASRATCPVCGTAENCACCLDCGGSHDYHGPYACICFERSNFYGCICDGEPVCDCDETDF
ncbi:MAG: hypothetical protein ACRDXX_11940 [Stackebrandtia sp.]